jgi:quercetin dioxygenase-like cupin family protein/DNA-binding XRE family transcriptional regulator
VSERAEPDAGADRLHLGLRLRALRKERHLSLDEVAKGSGISRSFLSLIENDRSDISFSKLIRLVNFYGISVTDIMPDPDPREDQIIVRREDRKHITSPVEGMDVFLLSPDTKHKMMPVIEEFQPGGHMNEYSSHEGEEFLYVLQGDIEVTLEGREPFVLREGDSAYYNADQKHGFRNAGEGIALLFAVVTPPFL